MLCYPSEDLLGRFQLGDDCERQMDFLDHPLESAVHDPLVHYRPQRPDIRLDTTFGNTDSEVSFLTLATYQSVHRSIRSRILKQEHRS